MRWKSRALLAVIKAVRIPGKKKLPKTQIIINRIKAKKQRYESLKKKGPRIQTSSELRYKSKQKPIHPHGGPGEITQRGTHYGLKGREHKFHSSKLAVALKHPRFQNWPHDRESWRSQMDRIYGGIFHPKKSIKILTKKLKKKKVKKLLAGGLLSKGIRLIYRDPKSREAIKKLTTYVKDIYKKKKLGPTGTLELKGRKIEGLKKYIDLIKSKSTVKHFKTKARADKALKVMDVAKHRLINYEKKHKSIVKAYMHKKANPQIKTHSEGGEIVVGKNVDRSLL